jgi:hypothetical protein
MNKNYDFSKKLEQQVRQEIEDILGNYPEQIPYVPRDLVEDLVKLALSMY